MASIDIRATGACTTLGHVHLRATKGAQTLDFEMVVPTIQQNVTAAEAQVALEILVRLFAEGRTLAQIRSALNGAGVRIEATVL